MDFGSPQKRTQQFELFFERMSALAKRLEELCGRPLDVQFHRNRWTYFSCTEVARRGRLRVRLHECFLDAPGEVIEALATLIRRENKQARGIIRTFIDEQSPIWDALSEHQARPPRLNTVGKVYDLKPLFDELNRRYFEGHCTARITWGKRSKTRQRHNQITLGSYEEATGIIRIHPILDRRSVPKYFVRYIIYHEMLHTVIPSAVSPSGKRIHHSRLFRQRERMFEDYERARAWEDRFLGGGEETGRPQTAHRGSLPLRGREATPPDAESL